MFVVFLEFPHFLDVISSDISLVKLLESKINHRFNYSISFQVS